MFRAIREVAMLMLRVSSSAGVIEKVKLQVVEHLDRPDYFLMRVFHLLGDGRTTSVQDLVELFYLSEMRLRGTETFELAKCARAVRNAKIKNVPVVNR